MANRVRLTQKSLSSGGPRKTALINKKADPNSLGSDRPYEPERSFAYGTDGWLEYEKVREVPELGPKEPRDDMNIPEFKEAFRKESAYAYHIQKARKCLKIASNLVPNLKTNDLKGFATALLTIPGEYVDQAYDNLMANDEVKAAAEAKSSESKESKSAAKPVKALGQESKSSESQASSEEVTFEASQQEHKEAHEELADPTLESALMNSEADASSFIDPEIQGELLADIKGSALDQEDDLFGSLFNEDLMVNSTEAAAEETQKMASKKKGIKSLGGGPREKAPGDHSLNYLQDIWKSDPDVSGLF